MSEQYSRELDALYRRVLGRPIDPSGYETYSALLRSGEKSLAEIAAILRGSEEFAMRQQARERAERFRAAGERRASGAGTSPVDLPAGFSATILLLESDPPRVAHVRDCLAPSLVAQGVSIPRVVAAIDGSSREGHAEIAAGVGFDEERVGSSVSAFMRRKLGCALSHVRAWAALGSEAPGLVLEDDAVVAPDLAERAAAILCFVEEEHPGWHLVHLYSPGPVPDPREGLVVPYRESSESHHGNVGYLISAPGRTRLSQLTTERIAALDAVELAKAQDEPHFALDHSIVRWARQREAQVFWATEHLVETIGQVGPERQADDLGSNIFRQG